MLSWFLPISTLITDLLISSVPETCTDISTAFVTNSSYCLSANGFIISASTNRANKEKEVLLEFLFSSEYNFAYTVVLQMIVAGL